MSTADGKPHLCVIHEGIGEYNAISKAAKRNVEYALEAGWRVSVVAKFLQESLRGGVEWLRLFVPPRGFFVQWTTARLFIKRALGGRTFDVVHAHQPQVADLSDVFHCHFLTRVAYERGCLETRPGLRAKAVRVQQQGVLYAEDYFYRRWNPRTHMLFNSELTRREFARLYGMPPKEQVLVHPCPPPEFPPDIRRREARDALVGKDFRGTVVGYLGGVDERKGYKRLIAALEGPGADDLFLLMGGIYSEHFRIPSLPGRHRSLGIVRDTDTFYDACDVLVVPSLFEPLGFVVFEAAARGVPVIAAEEVGALPCLLEHGGGLAWPADQPLAPLVRRAAAERDRFRDGIRRMAAALSQAAYARQLLGAYAGALREKGLTHYPQASAGSPPERACEPSGPHPQQAPA